VISLVRVVGTDALVGACVVDIGSLPVSTRVHGGTVLWLHAWLHDHGLNHTWLSHHHGLHEGDATFAFVPVLLHHAEEVDAEAGEDCGVDDPEDEVYAALR
jgi:hypothetical protein